MTVFSYQRSSLASTKVCLDEMTALCQVCRVKRKTRLFAMVEVLRGRRTGITADALAERFGVTVRTIYRDLESLRDGSLPLIAERGRGGGYALDRSYTLPPVNFTAREAAVLLTLGRWASELRLIPFQETLASGLDKVRAALSSTAQKELLSLLSSMVFVGVPTLPVPKKVREAVETAWFEHRWIRLVVQSKDYQVKTVEVRIESIFLERTFTALHCAQRSEAPISIRLDKVLKADLLPAAS